MKIMKMKWFIPLFLVLFSVGLASFGQSVSGRFHSGQRFVGNGFVGKGLSVVVLAVEPVLVVVAVRVA